MSGMSGMRTTDVCPMCGGVLAIENSEKEALIDALTAIASAISFCETDMQIVVQDRLNLVYDAIDRLNGT